MAKPVQIVEVNLLFAGRTVQAVLVMGGQIEALEVESRGKNLATLDPVSLYSQPGTLVEPPKENPVSRWLYRLEWFKGCGEQWALSEPFLDNLTILELEAVLKLVPLDRVFVLEEYRQTVLPALQYRYAGIDKKPAEVRRVTLVFRAPTQKEL